MLFLLSPAKTFSNDLRNPLKRVTQPLFTSESQKLINELRPQSVGDIQKLMKLSENLACLNVGRYRAWEKNHSEKNSQPAIFRFYGDVYKGLQAEAFAAEDVEYAQDHVGVLSGLYGFLRPLDLMKDYRLEMGTKLHNAKGKDLYAFWSGAVTDYLNNQKEGVIVNLASKEYSSVIDSKSLNKTMIEIVFKEKKGDAYKIVAIYAKKARGVFARWALTNQVEKLEDLKNFNEEGYRYESSLSTDTSLTFVR